jgi:hypothetical protein
MSHGGVLHVYHIELCSRMKSRTTVNCLYDDTTWYVTDVKYFVRSKR